MNDQDPNIDLEQVWQSINLAPEFSAHQLEKMAKKSRNKNRLIFTADLTGNGIVLWGLYLAWSKDASLLIMLWLFLAFLFGLWLMREFYKIRQAGELALTGSTASYQNYLIEKANSDIKVGKLFNVSNLIVSSSMALVFILEQWFIGEPLLTSTKDWVLVVCWASFWIGLMFVYGFWKIRKGKKVLKHLASTKG
jgi:hypothetical protein